MPGKVKVKVIAGRHLPVMDRSNDTTDAYVELKLGGTSYKTEVCKKSLNPSWNTDWFRFEVEDSELQDEPLQIRLMDYDTYSANVAIGKIYIDLNPLLLPRGSFVPKMGIETTSSSSEHLPNTVMSGWIPVYDTLQGIRGEVNIMVKVELFSDYNRFRKSSCGVQFFCSPTIPFGYVVKSIHGFVEELIVKDDPEYQWIDKIRTHRASNEARQFLLFKLYGELQRKIGVKTLECGGNAVIGYRHYFDLEGDFGIVARGIGTAVSLIKRKDNLPNTDIISEENVGSPIAELIRNDVSHHCTEPVGARYVQSPLKAISLGVSLRRSSESDLSITPKGSSLTGSDKSYGHVSIGFAPTLGMFSKLGVQQENFDNLDYPFITMTKFPVGFIIGFGGVVSARSVKRLDRISSSVEPESRALWWNELRLEIRAHARSLHCNAVLAYTEHATVCEGISVLSATGTAAVVGDIGECSRNSPSLFKFSHSQDIHRDREKISSMNPLPESPDSSPSVQTTAPCQICHIPFAGTSSGSQSSKMHRCAMCRSGKVADVLMSNTELPDGIPTVGGGCLIQAYVCRPMKDSRNEPNAREMSDCLPFLEYELHRLLMNKVKIKGMNALFGLRIRISIGAKMVIGIATGTGVFLQPLHTLPLPLLVASQTCNEKNIADMQRLLTDTLRLNKEIHHLKHDDVYTQQLSPDQEVFEDEILILDPTYESRDCSILEVDDPEDMEIMNLLLEPHPPDGFRVVNTESIPGLEEMELVKCSEMFTQIWRTKVQQPYNLNKYINQLLQNTYFKLRRMIPCALCDLQFRVDLPELDEIQLSIIGTLLAFSSKPKALKTKAQQCENEEEENIFVLEDDIKETLPISSLHVQSKSRGKSPQRSKASIKYNCADHEWHGVDITSMSYLPGGRVDRYLGNLNLFFIRETTSIREEGGLSGFVHIFILEVLAIVRSHITALGGNAMLSYYMNQCVISHHSHKNQGQCLINVGGDVVFVSHFAADE